tara:strand:- start:757 stop:1371 length:615 start_codon:yes stop_codon:yes gene_type:complete
MYNDLLTYGDFIQLKNSCNSKELLEEIKDFVWYKYNPRKNVERYGLSVTSEDGKLTGKDLDSLYEYSKEMGKIYDEDDFTTFTDVYYKSKQVQKLVDPFKPWLCRTHFLNFRKGGYFPPHIDNRGKHGKQFIRLLVPIRKCNPSFLYFMYEDKLLNFNRGYTYFLNTNKKHAIFSFSDDSTMLVMNIKCCQEAIDKIHELMLWK